MALGPAKIGQTMFQLSGSSRYSPDKWYTKSTDNNGHSERMRIRIPPQVEAMISGLVSEFSELDTVESFIRDSVIHRIVYVRDNYTNIETNLEGIELERQAAQIAAIMAEIAQRNAIVAELENSIDALCEVRDWETLVQILTNADDLIDNAGWPEGPLTKLKSASDYGWTTLRTEQRRRRKSEQ